MVTPLNMNIKSPKTNGRFFRAAAMDLLARAGGNVKAALVMHARKVDAESADRLLAGQGGVVRRLIDGE